MLILTRKLGESFFIGDDIQVAVLAIKKGQVDLGVIAPREVLIYRKEIYDAIKQQGMIVNLDHQDDGA